MLALAMACALPVQAEEPLKLAVFVQGGMKPQALEKALEEKLPNVDVTVYGRYQDFKDALEKTSPDAAIARLPVLEACGLTPTLKGTVRGRSSEMVMVMAANSAVDPATLAEKTLGVVDILGRKDMPKFLAVTLKLSTQPKIKPVTKADDLLPLLQFNSADAIVVPANTAEELKKRSQMDLKTFAIDGAEIGLSGAALISDRAKSSLKPALGALPKNLLAEFGVESW